MVTEKKPEAASLAANGRHTPFRGEIWWMSADGDHSGSQAAVEAARRPVLVIQNNVGNTHAPTVIAAAVSSLALDKRYPQMVTLDAELLGKPATVRCDLIETVDRGQMIERAAVVPRGVMVEVDAALRRSLALK